MANAAGLPQDLLSMLYHHGMEIDALVRVEVPLSFFGHRPIGIEFLVCSSGSDSHGRSVVEQTERTRAGLEDTRRRHVQALLLAAERAAARRLRAADAALELARSRNANLSERLGQISAEGQAWIGVAKSHEAAVAGLRATLDQLLQSQSPGAAAAEGAAGEGADAEDARSCCFETPVGGDDAAAADDHKAASNKSRAACKACGEGESRVLVLPCRHLCLCPACDAAVDKCPVCAATKNASLHVLLS
jgi:E3 ubiquitin-protein ligase BOI-like protein